MITTLKKLFGILMFWLCASMCVQQAPDRVGQSEAVYEVVSLQREAERSNGGRERIVSPNEEEEADQGKPPFYKKYEK